MKKGINCDCESSQCNANGHNGKQCKKHAVVKITIFGMKENLCEACLYQINPDLIEATEKLVVFGNAHVFGNDRIKDERG